MAVLDTFRLLIVLASVSCSLLLGRVPLNVMGRADSDESVPS